MTILLQVSDAHFGTERPPVVQALLELASQQAPDLVVFSGDITQRARRSQFRAARAFADQLKPPALLAIPGNHDIPLFNLIARLFSPYANYSRAFGQDLEPVFEAPDVLVVCVNTTRPRRHKHGEVSPVQIDRVAARLRRAAVTQLRIVVVHQPVLAIRASDEVNVLRGHALAVPAWADAGADIVMGGHIHLPYVKSLRARFPDLSRDMWTVQAGTAVSSRIREGIDNSVNILRCQEASAARQCIVERWLYSPAACAFVIEAAERLSFTGGFTHAVRTGAARA